LLDVIVFLSGTVLVAVEIIASRIIAPVFGNSIYIWGSLIGVVLAALAVGYAAGGSVADRWPSLEFLTAVVFCAGLLVVPIPLVAPRILASLSLADLGPRAGPFAAALALFFLPTAVMGMVSPFAIRLRASTVATLGNVAGALFALSTLGSIAGALLASFVLLTVASVRVIVSLLGAVLLVLALGSWLMRRRLALAAGAAVVAVLAVGMPALRAIPPESDTVRYERDTVYHRITVTDGSGVRYLKLDNYWQSAVDLAAPRRTVFAYSDYMHLPVLFRPQARRMLMIGLGGGTVPTRYVADYPQMHVEVVELDPAVVDVARRYFHVPVGDRLRVIPEDGRLFLTRSSGRYDIMLLDAYLIDTIPFHLATREFFAAAKAHLAPGGVLGSNIIGALQGPRSGLFRAIYRTVASVFPTVYVFPVEWGPVGNPEALRNIILVATDQPRLTANQVRAAAAQARAMVTLPQFEEAAGSLYETAIGTADVPVLTDDFAPVETLIQWR
jgi:spermidine synthase